MASVSTKRKKQTNRKSSFILCSRHHSPSFLALISLPFTSLSYPSLPLSYFFFIIFLPFIRFYLILPFLIHSLPASVSAWWVPVDAHSLWPDGGLVWHLVKGSTIIHGKSHTLHIPFVHLLLQLPSPFISCLSLMSCGSTC